jgi:hypothetical protein
MMDITSEIPEWWRLLEVLTLGRGCRLARGGFRVKMGELEATLEMICPSSAGSGDAGMRDS